MRRRFPGSPPQSASGETPARTHRRPGLESKSPWPGRWGQEEPRSEGAPPLGWGVSSLSHGSGTREGKTLNSSSGLPASSSHETHLAAPPAGLTRPPKQKVTADGGHTLGGPKLAPVPAARARLPAGRGAVRPQGAPARGPHSPAPEPLRPPSATSTGGRSSGRSRRSARRPMAGRGQDAEHPGASGRSRSEPLV